MLLKFDINLKKKTDVTETVDLMWEISSETIWLGDIRKKELGLIVNLPHMKAASKNLACDQDLV